MKALLSFLMISLSLSFLPPEQAGAQTINHPLTLQDALEIAKQQSADALNAKQLFRSSFWEYRTFRATYLPNLYVDGTIPEIQSAFQKYVYPDGTVSYVHQQNTTYTANAYLNQKIGITGGNVFLRSGLQRLDNHTDSTVVSYLSTPINIGYTQPLFQYNPYRWDRKIQPLKFDQAKKRYLEDLEQLSITSTNYFFGLLQAQIDKKIALTNLKNSDTLYRIAKGRYQLGKIAENDLLQLELNYLKAQAAIENANLAVDNAMFRLKSFLRIKDTTNIVLVPPADIKFFTIDPVSAVQQANRNTSTALDFQKRLLEAARDVSRAKTEGRFDANLTAIFGLTQSAPNIPDAYYKPLDQQQVGLQFTVPIVDWGVARGKIKMAQSQQEIVKNSVEQELIDFQRNIYLKVVQFNMQERQLMIAAKSDTVASKSYDVTKGRYLIGKINSILDLNNAQIETDNAQKNYYNALETYWRGYFEIRKLTLFDFRKNELLQFNIKEIKL
ncbi:MAG: TolC family protein [Bacteroidetes bacterium]|nr:TolC family protein [Bacteroidota bacterium]